MWMVGGYNDTSHHHQHQHQVSLDGFNGGGRRLRPLIPRPPPAIAASPSSATTHSCNFGLYTASHLFGAAGTHEQGIFSHKINAANNFNKEEEQVTTMSMSMSMTMNNNGNNMNNNNNNNNNNNGGGGEGGGGVMSSLSSSSSRWNPTAEQVRTLEELYRRGTRTPSTEQIQRITAQLRRYGKIEGKNVFYWFQNHKARERQKRRRQHNFPSSNSNSNHHHHDDHDADADDHLILPRKEPGPATGKQCFQAERTRSHYSAADAEECGAMSMQRARVAEKACTEHNNERNATWHNLAPSSSSLIARIITSTTTPPTSTDGCAYTTPKTRRFIASLKEPSPNTTNRREPYEDEDEDGDDDSATLQLFPMRSQVDGQQQQERDQLAKSNVDRDVHFFEFLPPKLD